VTATEKVK